MTNETTKPEALVDDETIRYWSEEFTAYFVAPIQVHMAKEIVRLREALVAAKRDGIREGLEMACELVLTNRPVTLHELAALIRAKANEMENT